MTWRAVRILVLAALAALGTPAQALARPTPDRKATAEAADLFQRSHRAYREGRFQEAVDLLLRARELKAEPVLLYDLGRAYEALGKPAAAADAYTQFLQEDPNASDRLATEGRIATLRRQAEEQEASRAAAAAQTEKPSPPAPPAPSPPPPAPPAPASDPVAVVPWVVGGAGVLAAGVGVVFAVMARSRYDDALAEPVQSTSADKYDGAKRDSVVSNVGFVAGGVLLVTAGVWLILRATAPSAAAARGLRPGLVTF
jgi:tetratricopeptide (TPR) repeat protein